MTRARRNGQAGFTLLELMAVVIIIGIATSIGVVTMRKEQRAIDTADRLAQLIREGQRVSVGAGRLPDALQASLALTSGSARGRLLIAGEAADGSRLASFTLLAEANGTFDTSPVVREMKIDKVYRIAGATDSAVLTDGVTPTAIAPATEVIIYFYPDGRIGMPAPPPLAPRGATIYIEMRDNTLGKKARTVVMPLGGTVTTFKTW